MCIVDISGFIHAVIKMTLMLNGPGHVTIDVSVCVYW